MPFCQSDRTAVQTHPSKSARHKPQAMDYVPASAPAAAASTTRPNGHEWADDFARQLIWPIRPAKTWRSLSALFAPETRNITCAAALMTMGVSVTRQAPSLVTLCATTHRVRSPSAAAPGKARPCARPRPFPTKLGQSAGAALDARQHRHQRRHAVSARKL